MIDGYVPLKEQLEFEKKHRKEDAGAILCCFGLCQRTEEKRKKVLKEGETKIYDMDKVYKHTATCVRCQNWLRDREDRLDRYRKS